MGGKFADRVKRKKIGGKVKKIKTSRRQGISLQNRWEVHLRERFRYVFKSVDIQGTHVPRKPMAGPSFGPTPKTSGAVPEADFLVGDSLDDLHPVEIKRTPKSGQTGNQRLGYPKINEHGGRVVVKKPMKNLVTGELHALEGVDIKPQRFIRLYEVDAVAVEANQTTTDELFDKRKGQLSPKPTPLQLPPATEGTPAAHGTSNSGADDAARSRARPKAGDIGDRAINTRGITARTAAERVPGRSPRRLDPTNVPGAGGALDIDKAPVRTSSGFLKNLAKGFVLEMVKNLVLDALIGPYERKLGEVNLEQTARSFKAFILPQVEPVLRGELADTYEVIFNPDKRVWSAERRYLLVWWYQYTEEQAAGIGDVAVWAYRFPEGFAEVFDSVETNPHGPYGTPFANFHTRRRYKGRTPSREEIKRNGKTYYRYSFVTAILVWDRDVARLVWDLSKVSTATLEHVKAYSKLDSEQRQLLVIFEPQYFEKFSAAIPSLRRLHSGFTSRKGRGPLPD